MKAPLSSKTTPAITQAITCRRSTRPSTKTPVPARTRVTMICTVYASRSGAR